MLYVVFVVEKRSEEMLVVLVLEATNADTTDGEENTTALNDAIDCNSRPLFMAVFYMTALEREQHR